MIGVISRLSRPWWLRSRWVVLDELRDREPEVALTERNELVEALGLE